MLLQPTLLGSQAAGIPLADATADALIDALLAEGSPRVSLLERLCRTDPFLFAWAMLETTGHGQPLASWAKLAALLADALGTTLYSALSANGQSIDQGMATAAADVVVIAEIAERLASEEDVDQQCVHFAGLLEGSRQLLAGDVAEALPASPDWALAFYDRAADLWNDSKEAEGESDRQALGDVHRTVREHLLTTIPGARDRLKSLVQQTARLQALERDYQQTLETEKLESMRQLAYGAGHEINNPLANISARAQTLLRDETDAERRRTLSAINSQAFRAHEMIADLMLFARPPKMECETIDLGRLVEEVVASVRPIAAEQGTAVEYCVAEAHPQVPEASNSQASSTVASVPNVMVSVDPVQLAVAVRAICVNSLEALANGGNLIVCVQQASSDRQSAAVEIHDNGPGIPAEVRPHIFDPFYSGREAGRGLGFGLSKGWRIVTEHGGKVEVESKPGRGTTFRITL